MLFSLCLIKRRIGEPQCGQVLDVLTLFVLWIPLLTNILDCMVSVMNYNHCGYCYGIRIIGMVIVA